MNKNIILVSLLALHCGLFAAEKKSDSTERKTSKTEGELVLDVLRQCNAGAFLQQSLLDLWHAGPAVSERVGGQPLWDVELPADATVAGVPLLAQPKTVAFAQVTCANCPQIKTYKVPTKRDGGLIRYIQLVVGGMCKNGKCAVSVDCHNCFSSAELFRTPAAIMLSSHIAPLVKKALNITAPCESHSAAKEAALDDKTVPSEAKKE